MKTFLKISLALTLLLAIAALLAGTALWNEIGAHPDMTLSINGETLPLEHFGPLDWAGSLFGMLIAGLVIVIVVPLVLLLGLGLPLLILGLGLAVGVLALFSVGALMLSPLLIVGLLLWLLLRDKKRPAARPASTNPEPTR